MPKQIEASGKTVEQAIEKGLSELNLTIDQVDVTVLNEGGFLKRIKVLVSQKVSEQETAQVFVEKLLDHMRLKFIVEPEENPESVKLNLIGTDSSAILGQRGEVLDAIQTLATQVVNKNKTDVYKRVVLDCDGFRAKRDTVIIQMAKNLEGKVNKSRRPTRLEPMNPYERRLIHATLQESTLVETKSEGLGKDRYVIIYPKGMAIAETSNKNFGKENNNKMHKYAYRTKTKK